MGLSASVSAATLSYLRTNTRRLPDDAESMEHKRESATNKSFQEYYYS